MTKMNIVIPGMTEFENHPFVVGTKDRSLIFRGINEGFTYDNLATQLGLDSILGQGGVHHCRTHDPFPVIGCLESHFGPVPFELIEENEPQLLSAYQRIDPSIKTLVLKVPYLKQFDEWAEAIGNPTMTPLNTEKWLPYLDSTKSTQEVK